MNSRRHFIKRCSGALLGSAAAPVFGTLASTRTTPAARLDLATFTGHLDSAFGLVAENRAILPVTLSKVEVYQPTHRSGLEKVENFNLHFASSTTEALEQGTYGFEHPSLGRIDLFVVPHTGAAGHIEYVATFHGSPIPA